MKTKTIISDNGDKFIVDANLDIEPDFNSMFDEEPSELENSDTLNLTLRLKTGSGHLDYTNINLNGNFNHIKFKHFDKRLIIFGQLQEKVIFNNLKILLQNPTLIQLCINGNTLELVQYYNLEKISFKGEGLLTCKLVFENKD